MNLNQKYKRSGWFKESYRHMLASKGIKTSKWKPKRGLFDFQDKNLEHSSMRYVTDTRNQNIPRGQAYEAAGDIFRESAFGPGETRVDKDYVDEKMKIINDVIGRVESDMKSRRDYKGDDPEWGDKIPDEVWPRDWGIVDEDVVQKARDDIVTLRQMVEDDPEMHPDQHKMMNEALDVMKVFTYQDIDHDKLRKELKELRDVLPRKTLFQAKKQKQKLTGKQIDTYKREDLSIPITERKTYKSHTFPITVDDLKKTFDKIPIEQLRGLKEISFRPPSRLPFTEQTSAWAQYANMADRINIYSEPFKITKKDGFRYKGMSEDFDEYDEGYKFMTNFVIPHEVGHHYALDTLGFKDDPQLIAEARADTIAFGQNPNDGKVVRKFAKRRLKMFPR